MSFLDKIQSKPSVKNPREMIIFSLPKVGKTELFTKLPGKYVILDFEGGSDFYEANKININDKETFDAVAQEFAEKSPVFDFIVIDTLTSFYSDIVNSLAVEEYNLVEGDNKPLDWNVTQLAYGQGYSLKRDILQKILKFFKNYCKTLIISGHIADKSITDASGVQFNVKDLDIEGENLPLFF